MLLGQAAGAEKRGDEELRKVTAIFSDLSGYTAMSERLGPEETKAITSRIFSEAAAIAKKYDGRLDRLVGDCALILFGIPHLHEDDEVRALMTAMEIHAFVDSLNIPDLITRVGRSLAMHTGVNTGTVVAGRTDFEAGTETVVGDAVNLASRLKDLSKRGEILAGADTHRLTVKLFDFEALPPVEVKGKAEPVRVYRLIGARDVSTASGRRASCRVQTPLIGRETEIASIGARIESLRNRKGGILSIIGEAGVGKSRLVVEAKQRFFEKGSTPYTDSSVPLCLEGHCMSFGRALSYLPFQEMIRTWAGIKAGEEEAEAWGKLETRIKYIFNGGATEQLPYIASLLSMNLKGEYAGKQGQLDGEVMGHRVFAASRKFFERLAEQQPLILIFEDLHWLDDSSARLLEHLLPLATRSPILIMLLIRPDGGMSWNRLRETALRDLAACYSEIRLTALTPMDSERMVAAMLDTGTLDPRFRDSIMSKSGGNPFFLEEIVSSLIDSKVLTSDQATGRWRYSSHLEEIAIPDTLLGVIMNRFDLLDESAKQVLRAASVIGRSFSSQILRSVYMAENSGQKAQGLELILEKLEASDFIRKEATNPDADCMFKHELARDAVYESILGQKRKELHARVGEGMETLFADQTERHSSILAYHFAQAESWEKAQLYLLQSGDRAERIAADGEALDSYRRAMEIYRDAFGTGWTPLQNASLERKVGEAFLRRGDHASALDHLRKALAHLGAELPVNPQEFGKAILSEALKQIGHLAFYRFFKRRQSSILDSATQEEISIYESVFWLFDPRRMFASSLKILNISERNGFGPGIIRGSAFLAFLIDYVPFLKGFARYYFRRALTLGAKIPEPGSLMGPVHVVFGIHENSLGHWDAVRAHARQAIDAYAKGGEWNIRGWRFAILGFADADIHQGNFRQALAHAEEVVRLGEESADRDVLAWGLCRQGFAQKGLGRFRESIKSLEKAMALLKVIPDHPTYLDAAGEYGQCHIRLGNLAKAIKVFEECARLRTEHLAVGSPSCTRFINGTAEAFLVAAEQSKEDQKTEWLLKGKWACREALRQGKFYPPGMPEAMMLRGLYEWLRGKRTIALSWWRRSAALGESMDVRYNLGRTIFEIGRRLKSREHLERARSIFADIEAEWDLSKVRAAIASS